MKKPKTKRILALVLSLLMVLTSFPVVAFTAFGADDALVDEVKTAMTAYETKMQSGKVYTNMGAAYEAYVNCQKALDAYSYGGVTNALSGKADALNSASNAMNEWSISFNAQAYHTTNVATDGYSNVVYTTSSSSSDQTVFSGEANDAGITTKYAVPKAIVIAYDGENEASVPAVLETKKPGKAACSSQKIIYAASNNGTMYFDGVWNGYMDGNWESWPKNNISTAATLGAQSSDDTHTHTADNKNTSRFWWNKLIYHGTGNTTDYYEKISNIGLTVYCSYSNWGTKYTTLSPSVTNDIYVINYAPVKNLIKSYQTALAPVVAEKGISKYKEGGLTDIINAISNLTAINPNSYDYSTVETGVQACANDIKAAVSANSNKSVGAVDSASYQAVRDAMQTNIINTYNNGQQTYTDETWAPFTAAYEAARDMMAAPYNNNTGYTATNGAAVAQTLTDTYAALKSNVAYADTTELVNAINEYWSYEGIFTAETGDAANAAVENAINAIWQNRDNYGVETAGPVADEAGNALVAEQTQLVKDAIAGLRIDPDATVLTTAGRFSLNDVVDYTVENPEYYANYVDFATAVDAAKQYRNTLPITSLTDYDAQYAAYKEQVQKVITAFFGLEYALTYIPDNTVYANDSVTTMKTMSVSLQGQTALTPTYTNKAVVIKTTHNTSTVPFGKFSLDLMTNITNGGASDNNKGNNIGIDSISIHATAAAVTDNILSTKTGFMTDALCPDNMSDTDRLNTYAGVLSYNGFSVSNLKYVDRTSNANPRQFIITADGTRITDEAQAKSMNLDTVLGVTDGKYDPNYDAATSHVCGVVFNHSTGGDAHVYVEGDFSADIQPSATVANMTRRTTPKLSNASLSSTRFGAVVNHAYRDTTFCSARAWFTSASNSENIVADVEVVDLAYLMDLIKICDEISNNSSKYTTESFTNFANALKAAKANYNYAGHTAQEFVTEAVTRYENLWDAKEALELAQYSVNFNYKNADGTDAVSTFSVEWGSTLESVKAQIEAIVTPDFVADGMTNTFKAWSPALDYTTVIYGDMNYTAQYDQFSAVEWDAYNAAQQKFINDLQNGPYYADGLDAIKALTDALVYFEYTDEQKGKVTADKQEAIDAEAVKISEIDAELPQYRADSSTYDALVKTVDTLNADAYDVAAVQAAMAETSAGREIIIGGVAYTGWDYDFFISTVMSKMNEAAYKYTVTVMDVDENEYFLMKDGSYTNDLSTADSFYYGDLVTAVNPVDSAQPCTWKVTITAKLTATETVNKYVGNDVSYTFNVRGNTIISTTATDIPEDYHTVTFVDGRNNTMIASAYVAHNKNLSAIARNEVLPQVPFYEISGFTDRSTGTTYTAKELIRNITSDMVLTVNYNPVETPSDYTIILLDASGNEIFNQTAKWNQKITLSAPGAAGMIDTKNNKVVAYGSEYSFYACQSITLQAADTVDGNVAVSVVQPVVSNGNVYFTGSFAKQGHTPNNDNTVKGFGIVIDVYGNNKELTLKNVDSMNGIFNLAASLETVGSQFTVYTTAPSNRGVTYRAYVIYEINGVEVIEYSDVVDTVIV